MRDINDIPQPTFESELNTIIVELEQLRVRPLRGTVPPYIFFQLKDIFQALESLGSARIEGNRTTILDYTEKVIAGVDPKDDEAMREIENVDQAIDYLEKNVTLGTPITRSIISELHKIIVKDLTAPNGDGRGEGSRTPGAYRAHPVAISKSNVQTSDYKMVPHHCEDLFTFINSDRATQYHLLVMSLAHHRMTVIHPFDNGNGRLVRLLTYAQLLQQGFNVKSGRILNPTAVFCDDRDQYYHKLSQADSWTDEGLLEWCMYVLQGLAREIEKIDRLLDREYLQNEILLVMLRRAREKRYITKNEYAILHFIVADSKDMLIKAGDLKDILGLDSTIQRTRVIKPLLEKKMIRPTKENGRIYTISFQDNYLLRELTELLIEKGFVPASLSQAS